MIGCKVLFQAQIWCNISTLQDNMSSDWDQINMVLVYMYYVKP